MPDTAQETQAPAQSVNGKGPVPPVLELPDTGEKWLGVGLVVAGVLLVVIGVYRATGRPLPGEGAPSGPEE